MSDELQNPLGTAMNNSQLSTFRRLLAEASKMAGVAGSDRGFPLRQSEEVFVAAFRGAIQMASDLLDKSLEFRHSPELLTEIEKRFPEQSSENLRRERIVRAAVVVEGGVWSVPPPMRHSDAIRFYEYGDDPSDPADDPEGSQGMMKMRRFGADEEQGFLTSAGRFVTREEAWPIALAAGQIIRRVGGDEGRLFSENLW